MNYKAKLLISLCLTTGLIFPACAKADSVGINLLKPNIVSQIDAAIAKQMTYFNYANVGISYKGNVVFTKSYGNSGVNTAYVYASTSKPVTSTIIMGLLEAGKIGSLDDSMWKYISTIDGQACAQKTYTDTPVTLKMLLTHTSGIPHNDKPTCVNGQLNLQFQPGTNYLYATPGFGVLGAIATAVTGKSYGQLVSEMIAQPIGATSFKVDNRFDAPGGFVYSTVGDMALFTTGMYGGKYMSDNLLYNTVWIPYHTQTGLGDFGLGWLLTNAGTQDLTAFHPGSNAADVATIRIKPRKQIGIGMLANAKYNASTSPLEAPATDIMTIMESDTNPLLGTPTPIPPTIRPTLPPAKPGDANNDGKVDDQDYVIWAKNYGLTNAASVSQGDFNGDKKVDDLDYVIWAKNFGV